MTEIGDDIGIDQRAKFFDFWIDLPISKRIDSDSYSTILHSSVRSLIISMLAQGISEIHPVNQTNQKRRALSAKEIGNILSTQYQIDVKKANLYFHLQKLEDVNLIHVVDTTRKGKRFTSYYGRTARIFLSDDDLKMIKYKIFDDENFSQLIHSLNEDLTSTEVEKALSNLHTLNEFKMSVFEDWVQTYQDHMKGLDLELYELFKIFSIINRFTPQIDKALRNLAQLLYYDEEILASSDQIFQRDTSKTEETIILSDQEINEFWKNAPIMKVFPNSTYTKILGSKQITDKGTIVRSSIVKVMQEGHLDAKSGTIRHACTAKEILDKMNEPIYREIIDLQTTLQKTRPERALERDGFEMQIDLLGSEVLKKSNLYFHLQKLEEDGFVREIGFVKKGKRHTAYYGLTAKIFAPTNLGDQPRYPILETEGFKQLISRISPKSKPANIEKILDDLKMLNEYHVELFQMWTGMFVEALSSITLDYSELSKLMMLTIRFNPDTIENLHFLAKVLHIPQISK
ncbi:MAG: helix-turn-helix transcriptional regulator [Candidatus Heimdallarchaeota archaeon]|nr:helix-turn-helix transcriptional regulator [Candidatus Heimdallarchaeota archaeon]